MNVVYESDKMVVVDDREFITQEEAFEILYSGKSISVCDPPDYGAENEWQIHSSPFTKNLSDFLSEETYKHIGKYTEEQLRKEVYEYLRGYELSK